MKKFLTIVFKNNVIAELILVSLPINCSGQSKTGYAQVKDLKMYYEDHGTGNDGNKLVSVNDQSFFR